MTISAPGFSGIYRLPIPDQTKQTIKSLEKAADDSPERQALNAAAEAHKAATASGEKDKVDALKTKVQDALVNLQKMMISQLEQVHAAFQEAKPTVDKAVAKLKTEGANQVAVLPDPSGENFFIYTDDSIPQLKAIADKVRQGQADPKQAESELKQLQASATDLAV